MQAPGESSFLIMSRVPGNCPGIPLSGDASGKPDRKRMDNAGSDDDVQTLLRWLLRNRFPLRQLSHPLLGLKRSYAEINSLSENTAHGTQ